MIDIKIFQVEQGFCSAIELSHSKTILIDCGLGKNFKPADYIWHRQCKYLDYLILPAYTNDHLKGFSDLVTQSFQHDIPIHFLVYNPILNPEQISSTKPFPLPLANSLYNPIGNNKNIEVEGLKLTFFWNENEVFSTQYSLSLVTFLEYADINIIFPSDLDNAGWHSLLKSYEFRRKLEQVNIFVASNHGEEKGYCREVFNYCKPEIVIVSNKDNKPVNTTMKKLYSNHAKGAIHGVSDDDKKIYSTYEDGGIKISKYLDRLKHISTQHQGGLNNYLDNFM